MCTTVKTPSRVWDSNPHDQFTRLVFYQIKLTRRATLTHTIARVERERQEEMQETLAASVPGGSRTHTPEGAGT